MESSPGLLVVPPFFTLCSHPPNFASGRSCWYSPEPPINLGSLVPPRSPLRLVVPSLRCSLNTHEYCSLVARGFLPFRRSPHFAADVHVADPPPSGGLHQGLLCPSASPLVGSVPIVWTPCISHFTWPFVSLSSRPLVVFVSPLEVPLCAVVVPPAIASCSACFGIHFALLIAFALRPVLWMFRLSALGLVVVSSFSVGSVVLSHSAIAWLLCVLSFGRLCVFA